VVALVGVGEEEGAWNELDWLILWILSWMFPPLPLPTQISWD